MKKKYVYVPFIKMEGESQENYQIEYKSAIVAKNKNKTMGPETLFYNDIKNMFLVVSTNRLFYGYLVSTNKKKVLWVYI